MESDCRNCGTHLENAWSFCAHCGARIPGDALIQSEPGKPETKETAVEPAPAAGAFSGLLFGLIAVPLLLIVGIMLCLTGLGAFLGVPMIFAAVLAPLLGPLFGMGAAKGKVL